MWKNSSWALPVTPPELRDPVILEGPDELVGESLGREVEDAGLGPIAEDPVPDGVHQVGLAQADPAVDEERVVALPGIGPGGDARGVGELVGGSDDEVVEAVLGVEVRGGAPRGRGRGADLGRRETLRLRRRGGDPILELLVDLPAHLECVLLGLALQGVEDQLDVVGADPVLEEAVGDAEGDRVFHDPHALDGCEPGLEVLCREAATKIRQRAFPQFGHRQIPLKTGARTQLLHKLSTARIRSTERVEGTRCRGGSELQTTPAKSVPSPRTKGANLAG